MPPERIVVGVARPALEDVLPSRLVARRHLEKYIEDPAVAAGWFDMIEAFEVAVGRMLGVEAGRVGIYDVSSLKRQLADYVKGES